MTDRALWAAAQEDYTNALKIASKTWTEVTTPCVVNAEALQAAAATVLIHVGKLRSEPRIHVQVPPQPVPATAAPSSGAVPPSCPKCGGGVYDNRDNKKNPKAPDWKCKSKTCLDPKTGYVTAGWVKDAGKANAYAGKNNDASSYEQPPVALQDGDGDDLPF
jgi:hypothetical protein